MKFLKRFAVTASMLLFSGALFFPGAQGQSTFSRMTHVTFSGPVEISGKVLPAGTYTFRLNALPGNLGNVVEVQNADGTKTIMNVLTIADYRLTPTSKTVVTFDERTGNSPDAVRAWFYPGENYGHEFVYPLKRAQQLAAANNVNVPAVPEGTADENLKSAHVTEATPSGSETEVATDESNRENPSPAPAAVPVNNNPPATTNYNNDQTNTKNEVASNQPLPKTASDTYSIAMLGGLLVSIALFIGVLRRVKAHGEKI
jgi:LPXTG-motif cell wall-anchored protein